MFAVVAKEARAPASLQGVSNKHTICKTCGQTLADCTGHFGQLYTVPIPASIFPIPRFFACYFPLLSLVLGMIVCNFCKSLQRTATLSVDKCTYLLLNMRIGSKAPTCMRALCFRLHPIGAARVPHRVLQTDHADTPLYMQKLQSGELRPLQPLHLGKYNFALNAIHS